MYSLRAALRCSLFTIHYSEQNLKNQISSQPIAHPPFPMHPALTTVICLIVLLTLNCKKPHPDEARAKQLFSEIDEIAKEPAGGRPKDEVMQAMMRLYEAKKTFPANREEIIADAQIGKEFFSSGIEGHNRIISKFEELRQLNLTESNVICIDASLRNQHAQVKNMENTLREVELFLDLSILDKETLDSRAFQMREGAELLRKKVDELDAEQKEVCSKTKLGID